MLAVVNRDFQDQASAWIITPISIKDLFQLRSNVSHKNPVFTCGLVENPAGTASSLEKSDKSMRENVLSGQTHSYEEITFARGSRLVEKKTKASARASRVFAWVFCKMA